MQLTLPKPKEHQMPVLVADARFKLPINGRRWGKTVLGLISAIYGHGPKMHDGLPKYKGAIFGSEIVWYAPTFSIFADIWRLAKLATKELPTDKREMEHRIEFPGGGSLTCRSIDDPQTSRGKGPNGVVVDEAAFAKEAAWHEVIRPSLADKRGWAILISTPNGNNWLKEVFDKAEGRPNWLRWQLPTSQNPLVSGSELEEIKLDLGPRRFAQEHEAQFMDTEGAEWPGVYFNDIMFDEWPEDIMLRVLSLDPSKGRTDRADYSAFVLLGLDAEGRMWVDADLERRDTDTIANDGMRLARQFRPQSFAVEANQFQELLVDRFAERSLAGGMMLPIHPVINTLNKETRIRATITPFLSRGELRVRNTRGGRLLLDQLQQFPEGKHDDGPDALEMAISETKRLFYAQNAQPETNMVAA